jgi:hypothetical protein
MNRDNRHQTHGSAQRFATLLQTVKLPTYQPPPWYIPKHNGVPAFAAARSPPCCDCGSRTSGSRSRNRSLGATKKPRSCVKWEQAFALVTMAGKSWDCSAQPMESGDITRSMSFIGGRCLHCIPMVVCYELISGPATVSQEKSSHQRKPSHYHHASNLTVFAERGFNPRWLRPYLLGSFT